MEEIQEKAKRRFNFESYGTVVAFLCLEVLAFVGFNLGHSFMLFGILSIVLAICLGLVTFRQINKDGITSFAFFVFPLFVYGLLTALSTFNTYSLGAIGVANSVFIPIALTFFALSGFLSFYNKGFKLRLALIVIYSSLAIFVLINFILTMIYYVPFYTLIYTNYYAYYLGKPSPEPIASMAYMLFGFKVSEVSLHYWSLFPSLLLTSAIPLFFIKFKENRREFLIFAACTFVAAISLLFTISKETLISDFVLIFGIAIIIVSAKFVKTRSFLNGFVLGICGITLLIILVMFINAQASWSFTAGLRKMIAGNSLLNRLFNTNRIVKDINIQLRDLFNADLKFFKIFGVPVYLDILSYPNFEIQVLSNIWLFDNLTTSGIFGSLFFLGALVIGLRRMFLYVRDSGDDPADKYAVIGFILVFLILSFFLYDNTPLAYSNLLVPIYTSAPMMIVIFLLGYTFNNSYSAKAVAIKTNEEVTTNEISL